MLGYLSKNCNFGKNGILNDLVDFKTLSVYCIRRKCKKLFFQNFTNV